MESLINGSVLEWQKSLWASGKSEFTKMVITGKAQVKVNTLINYKSQIIVSYLIAMRMAINMEHTGSAIIQPKACIKPEEMMTPTLPRVSARMCRNTPVSSNHIKKSTWQEIYWIWMWQLRVLRASNNHLNFCQFDLIMYDQKDQPWNIWLWELWLLGSGSWQSSSSCSPSPEILKAKLAHVVKCSEKSLKWCYLPTPWEWPWLCEWPWLLWLWEWLWECPWPPCECPWPVSNTSWSHC